MEGHIKAPFSMLVAGSRMAGKSQFTKNLLLSGMIIPDVKKIYWIYKTWQNMFSELRNLNIEFIQDLPNDFDSMTNSLIVFDDMMQEASNSEQVQSLFTRGRHLNISVIFLTQNLFHKGKHSRDISLNSDYIVLFKNVRDASQISHFGKQMYPNNTKFLNWAFKDATKAPFTYLFLDLRPDTDESIRVRANILGEYQIVYIPKSL